MRDQLDFLWRILPDLLIGFPGSRPGGLALSILLTAGSLVVGTSLGVLLGLAQESRLRILRLPALAVTRVVRGIPLLVLLVLVHTFVGAGRIPGIETTALQSAALTLTAYAAAYQADVVAAGVRSVPTTWVDHALLLGTSRMRINRTIVAPRALRTMRPALLTQAITVFKDSSVVVVLGVSDLTTNARIALGGDVGNAPYWVATYLLVGLLYWAVARGASAIVARTDGQLNNFETDADRAVAKPSAK